MLEHKKHNNTKKLKRVENRKKKLKALCEISSLNDQDRKKSSIKPTSGGLSHQELLSKKFKETIEEPTPKRMKRDFRFPLNGIASGSDRNEVHVRKDRGLLTEEQLFELKKLLKMRKKIRHERPFLELNEVGEAASVSLPESQRVPLPFDDFQHFLITSLHAHMGTKGSSRWINCKKYQKLERRICLIIEGVGLNDYLNKEADMKSLSQFEKQLEVLSPLQYGGDIISELALVSLTNSQRQKLASDFGSLQEAFNSGDIINALKPHFPIVDMATAVGKVAVNVIKKKYYPEIKPEPTRPKDNFPRTKLLLSAWDMIQEGYPIALNGKIDKSYSNFVFTRESYSEVTDNSPMWSVDCEMCNTAAGNELARICIVDEDCNIVYETLVKPHNPIRNYVTRYSGITPAMMKPVTTRLEDVQADIRAIIPPDVILVGQSLNFDLNAMKMVHPYVIDTSVIFNLSGHAHRKTKLKILTAEFLSLRIQTDDCLGHCPIEDAVAAMKLVQAKLSHSLSWGNKLLGGVRSEEESNSARLLLKSREAAGMARINVAESKRISWPQLNGNSHRYNGDALHQSLKGCGPSTYSIGATSLFSHLVRCDKNALLVAKRNDLDRFVPYCGNVKNRFQMEEVDTNRAIVKYVRDFTPNDGTGIAYVSLSSQQPENAIEKTDKLVSKLMKTTKENTLYSVLLAGSTVNPSNGVVFLHLAREIIPVVPGFK